MYDVIIVGAGVTGCAVARYLSRCQGSFLVLEREEDVCCGTSKANSAIVHAGFDAAHGSLMAKFNLRGSELMEPLSRELDFPYRRSGSRVVCMSESDRPRLNALYENGVKNGVPGLEIVERDRLRELEPNISPDAVAALWAPTGAIVCPFGLTIALAENCLLYTSYFRKIENYFPEISAAPVPNFHGQAPKYFAKNCRFRKIRTIFLDFSNFLIIIHKKYRV